jgi:hypothetical protein
MFSVSGIEIYDIISAPRRYGIQHGFRQIAVRVNDTNTATRQNVLNDQITEQGAFPGSGFANDVKVLSAIWQVKAEGRGSALYIPASELD